MNIKEKLQGNNITLCKHVITDVFCGNDAGVVRGHGFYELYKLREYGGLSPKVTQPYLTHLPQLTPQIGKARPISCQKVGIDSIHRKRDDHGIVL